MKKIIPFAGLLLAAACSWAFYPKPAEPTGYAMVISRFSGSALNAKNTLSIIMPNGEVQVQETDAKSGTIKKVANSFDLMHLEELKKLNELRQNGWRVVNSTQISVGAGTINETIYVLEK
ncbi:hypothetical protein [Hymenobacter psychrophilus]|uniref:Uncharacterized protein n=1 Tax=Hymenobacter psychrophilus TaxID=651662 RepID=A0A1H3MC00_9BACT|nr:hypothetical protein [Hymenobacter psychrophilus]SDY74240.1 hypothetical protein SAMN04488069_112138 [Hymenobacter psychrophilus]